ncbi:hypothetical protein GGH14_001224 [Coemansia sp. RSA 370]|nr:hypothetical protein GGH14_001224 [Coemansia sp. RSA 370]
MRVCLPSHFGKTFNLSVIEEFFNVVTCKDAKLVDGSVDKAAGRANRMVLFKDTLLREENPEFFEEHFCKIPVIRITMKDVKATSLSEFYETLAQSFYKTAKIWLSNLVGVEWNPSAKLAWDTLKATIGKKNSVGGRPGGWESNGKFALRLYEALEEAVASAYDTRCIVLLDEYDIPLVGIRNTSWEKSARSAYISLLNYIFKDNPYTHTGVLVGVHEIELGDLGSGLNNIETLALTVLKHTETLNANAMGIDSYDEFGELFAFTQPDVEALVEKVQEKNPHLEMYPAELIMSKIIEWYDGYCFGVSVGKFNPFAVTKFLKRLCTSSPDKAARCYWDETGNQELVSRITLSNPVNMLILATEFLVGCGNDVSFGAVKQAGVWQQSSPRPPQSRPVMEVSVGRGYAIDDSPTMSIHQLVSLFVYTGYLTIRQGGHIVIPNGEMRQMWGKLLKIASRGSDNAIGKDAEWDQLHANMYTGDIRSLHAGISDIMRMMPNMTNNYLECVYSDIFRTHMFTKFFDRSGSPSESASPEFLSEIETGMGVSDLIITFPRSGRLTDLLVVIIEFKRIEADKLDDEDYPLKRAREGLEQIIKKDYARSRGSFSLRLDIGIAMGCGKVVMRQRLWRRASGQLAATRRNQNATLVPKRHCGESVADWDVRLNNADDSGWQDANGWETVLLPSEFRAPLGI